jgi:hypothetical protein
VDDMKHRDMNTPPVKGGDQPLKGDLRLSRLMGIPGNGACFVVVLLAVAVLMLAPVCTADSYLGGIHLATVREGTVSGGLSIDAYPGLAAPAEQPFVLPENTDIQWARLYVDVYCGNQQNNYPVIATVDFDGGDGYRNLAVEDLAVPYSFPGLGGSGPVIVNDHCNRVTSDYLMWYDVGDLITRKNVAARVTTMKPPAYNGTYDGRVKTITLVVAYDDGDDDKVYYWVNQGHDVDSYQSEQAGNPYTGETGFSTGSLDEDWDKATLHSVYLASTDGEYVFNREDLDSGQPRGPYFGIDTWDVSSDINPGSESTLEYTRTPDATGTVSGYFKIFLATLEVRYSGTGASGGGGGGAETGGIGQWGTRVRITSTPDDAVIYIDGIEIDDRTNTTLNDISPGKHSFRVEKEGYTPSPDQTVQVFSGQPAAVSFELFPASAEFHISSVPAGAAVWIDGEKRAGVTPLIVPDLGEGEHSVTLALEGYQDFFTPVTLSSGEQTEMTVTLAALGSNKTAGSSTSGRVYQETGYRGGELAPGLSGTVRGNLTIATVSDYSGLIQPGESHGYPVRIVIPDDATVEAARLYVFTTWSHDEVRRTGMYSRLEFAIGGRTLPADAIYTDRKDTGVYDYPVETYAYDVTPLVRSSGDYSVLVTNQGTGSNVTAIYGVAAVVVYFRPYDPEIRYWVNEGSDIVFSSAEFGVSDDEARTISPFGGEIDLPVVSASRLIAISTAASGLVDESNVVSFNGKDWANFLDGGGSAISVAEIGVRPDMKASANEGSVGSIRNSGQKGDYMENRAMILVVENSGQSGDLAGEHPDNIPGAPLHVRIITVLDDIQRKIMAWTLYLAGASISLDEQQECNCGVQAGPVPTGSSPPVQATGSDHKPVAASLGSVEITTTRMTGSTAGEEAASVQPAFGGVYITSYPGEAEIYIDGRKTVYTTPFVAYGLKEGVHTITLKRNANMQTSQVTVLGNDLIHVAFTLEPEVTRDLYLNMADFADDMITIDGNGPPKYPAASEEMPKGDTFLTILHNGSFLSFMVPGVLQSGESYQIKADPSAGYPAIEVISNPAGARVVVDGFDTGVLTPAVLRNVSSGYHRIGVQKAGYLPQEKKDIFVDTSNEIDYTLKFLLESYAWGTLTAVSDPAGAKISLYGKSSGFVTPASIPYLAIGYYQVQVTDGEETRARDVIMEPGKNITVSFDMHPKQ